MSLPGKSVHSKPSNTNWYLEVPRTPCTTPVNEEAEIVARPNYPYGRGRTWFCHRCNTANCWYKVREFNICHNTSCEHQACSICSTPLSTWRDACSSPERNSNWNYKKKQERIMWCDWAFGQKLWDPDIVDVKRMADSSNHHSHFRLATLLLSNWPPIPQDPIAKNTWCR